MWSDNETRNDYLNYSETAELVSATLKHKNLRPVSLGLFGGWGVGKSSLMQMISDDVERDGQNIVLHFDAWLFQDYDDARAALLQKIGDTLFDRAKAADTAVEKVRGLYRRIDKLRVLGYIAEGAAFAAGIPGFGVLSRGIEGATDLFQGTSDAADVKAVRAAASELIETDKPLLSAPEDNSPPRQIENFRNELRSILEDLDCTLFVFVDNLDRCLPDKAIHTLEAIRLFLFMERTSFVIAADEEMIRLAVAQHYRADGARLVTDYLDKLVQIPVRVPRIGPAELRAFLIMLLIEEPANEDSKLRPELSRTLQSSLIDRLRLIWRDPFPEIEEILEMLNAHAPTNDEALSIRQAVQLAKRIAPLLANSARINGNPRIVKRMLNTIRMRQLIAMRRGITLSEEAMTKLVLFERCAGDRATNDLMALVSEAGDGKVQILKDLERGDPIEDLSIFPESWKLQQDFIGEWAQLDPKLGDLDLRAAAYLSRETKAVFSSSTGLSVVAERATKVLANATRQSAPSTLAAIKEIPPEEMQGAMEVLTVHLSNTPSWSSSPKGWAGALTVADADLEAAKALVAFIRSRNLDPFPSWMKAALKDKSWWIV